MKGVGDFLEPGGQCRLLREEAVILTGSRSDAEELEGHMGSYDRAKQTRVPLRVREEYFTFPSARTKVTAF